MRRIGLAVLLVASLGLLPPAEAQQPPNIPRLGYLILAPLSDTPSPERAAFLAGLRELGWIDGKTIAIEYRSAKWNVELLGAASGVCRPPSARRWTPWRRTRSCAKRWVRR